MRRAIVALMAASLVLCSASGGRRDKGTGSGPGTDDQTAAEVPFTPSGNLSSTDVDGALQELDSIKANASDLLVYTSGAGSPVGACSPGDLYRNESTTPEQFWACSASSAWTPMTSPMMAALAGRYDAIADLRNGFRWNGAVPTPVSNPCLLVQSVLNPWLSSNQPEGQTRNVLVSGPLDFDNTDLWDQGGTLPYGLCFGTIPTGPSTTSGAWIGGTYPDAWPNPLYDCNGASAGTDTCTKYFTPSAAHRRLSITWDTLITYDETTGQHGGGASDRATVVYQKANGFLSGGSGGFIAGGVDEFGRFDLQMVGDDDGGLAYGTVIGMCANVVCAAGGTTAQATASIGILEGEYTRNGNSARVNLSGSLSYTIDADGADNIATNADDYSTSGTGDNDNIGWVRYNTWSSSALGGGYIQGFATGLQFYAQNANVMVDHTVEYNSFGVMLGSLGQTGDEPIWGSCAAGGSGCTMTTTQGVSGVVMLRPVIEGNPFGEVVSVDSEGSNRFLSAHIESSNTNREADAVVLSGAGVCSGATIKRICTADDHCDAGTCAFPGATAQAGGLTFRDGSLPNDTGISYYTTRGAKYAGIKLGDNTSFTSVLPITIANESIGYSVPDGTDWSNKLSWWFEFHANANVPIWFNDSNRFAIASGSGAASPPLASYGYTASLRFPYAVMRSNRERTLMFALEKDDIDTTRYVAAGDCVPYAGVDSGIDLNADGDLLDAGETNPNAPWSVTSDEAVTKCLIPASYYSPTVINSVVCTAGDRTNWCSGYDGDGDCADGGEASLVTGSDVFQIYTFFGDYDGDNNGTDANIHGKANWDETTAGTYQSSTLAFGANQSDVGTQLRGLIGAVIPPLPGPTNASHPGPDSTHNQRGAMLALQSVATKTDNTGRLPHKYSCAVSFFSAGNGIQ